MSLAESKMMRDVPGGMPPLDGMGGQGHCAPVETKRLRRGNGFTEARLCEAYFSILSNSMSNTSIPPGRPPPGFSP